jgi:cystathionine beta-lyase/cystathionine gamma-synthase
MDPTTGGLETRLVHAGERAARIGGAVSVPIFQASVWEIEASGGYEHLKYPRYSNLPNHQVLAEKLASLEGAEAAIVAGSGMAAITATLLSVLKAGDHLLALEGVYGGTHAFVTQRFAGLGIDYDLIPGEDPEAWRRKLRPTTRAIYVETITNPLMDVPDLPAAVAFARRHGLLSLIDNTFATPVNFRPLEWGFDLALHSCTKYLNGHSDLVAGAAVGRADLVEGVHSTLKLLGGTLDGHGCFLLNRGLKTLALRVRQQNANALALARHLAAHPAVARVRYPGLADHPAHQRAARLFAGGFGGMLAFEPAGGVAAADRLFSRLALATHAPSLGGPETLVVSPARSSHAALAPEERARIGIRDELVRVSVGIETVEDLMADFDQALAG